LKFLRGKGDKHLDVYYLYEFLKKRNGCVSDFEMVNKFKHATSDEIFHAKCLFQDSQKKHNLLAGRRCLNKTNNRNNRNTKSGNQKYGN
jgi:hypothetical protein